jgi:hypothetical protein
MSANLWQPEGAYDSLATVTVGATAVATIEFAGLPSGYKHLQIRSIARNSSTTANDLEGFLVRYNGATTGYSWHSVKGNGTSAAAISGTTQTYMYSGYSTTNGSTSNTFGVVVIDILDYADTNKYKTQRVLTGVETNNSANSQVGLWSGLWQSTSAVTSITLYSTGSMNFTQYSSFALYGVK